jgi:hypothetical protein
MDATASTLSKSISMIVLGKWVYLIQGTEAVAYERTTFSIAAGVSLRELQLRWQ